MIRPWVWVADSGRVIEFVIMAKDINECADKLKLLAREHYYYRIFGNDLYWNKRIGRGYIDNFFPECERK